MNGDRLRVVCVERRCRVRGIRGSLSFSNVATTARPVTNLLCSYLQLIVAAPTPRFENAKVRIRLPEGQGQTTQSTPIQSRSQPPPFFDVPFWNTKPLTSAAESRIAANFSACALEQGPSTSMSPPFWGSANLSTGRLHFFRKFALGRQFPRYDLEVRRVFPQFFADHIVRVENERLPLGDMANEAKRRGKIGIAADKYERICRIPFLSIVSCNPLKR